MKKRLSYLVLLVLLLFSGSSHAILKHYAGFGVNVGEWTLLPFDKQPNAAGVVPYEPSVGAAGSLGFQYEMQYKRRPYSPASLLVEVGVSVKGGWTNFFRSYEMEDFIENCPDFDPIDPTLLSNTFTYYYRLKNRDDHYFNLGVQIPLMVGVQYKRFYGLAGVKVNYNLFNWNLTKGSLTTYGMFPDFETDQEQHNIPPYQLFDNIEKNMLLSDSLPHPSSVKVYGIDASLELGFRFGDVSTETGFDVPKKKIEYRIAAFADFGLLDWHQNPSENRIMLHWSDTYLPGNPSDPRPMVDRPLNDVLALNSVFGNKEVHNLFVGLKFTMLFALPEPRECPFCHESYLSTAKSGNKGHGVSYEEEKRSRAKSGSRRRGMKYEEE